MAFFVASQMYRNQVAYGNGFLLLWDEYISFQLTSAFIWAFFTPMVVAFAERLSFQRHIVRDVTILVVAVPLLATVRAAFGGAVMNFCEFGYITQAFVLKSVAIRFHQNVFRILVIVAITRIAAAWAEARRSERHAADLQTTLTRAHLGEMRTRLQPDFVMHALKTIGERIRGGDPSSDSLIVRFGDLLRHVLQIGRQTEGTLEGELDLLDRYLRFQEVISGMRIERRFELDEKLLATPVPLMLLQPLLNEAIGEVRRSGRESLRVTFRGRKEGAVLKLEIEDDSGATSRMAAVRLRERTSICLSDARVEAFTRGGLHTTLIDLPLESGVGS